MKIFTLLKVFTLFFPSPVIVMAKCLTLHSSMPYQVWKTHLLFFTDTGNNDMIEMEEGLDTRVDLFRLRVPLMLCFHISLTEKMISWEM